MTKLPSLYRVLIYAVLALMIVGLLGLAYSKGRKKAEAPEPVNHYSAEQLAKINTDGPRLLAIDGTRNFRDLGGYRTKDGKVVRWGSIYRSDNLAHLDEVGLAALDKLGLSSIADLRSAPERMHEPDILPDSLDGVRYQTLPINDEPVDIRKIGRDIITGKVNEEEMLNLLDHRRFINDPKHRETWGAWLEGLAKKDRTPHLFHCTSGKDRAGYGAAIFLLTLGVPKETVKEDFLLTNTIMETYISETLDDIDRKVPGKIDRDLFRKIMGVSEETIDATFAEMERLYGSTDKFIEEGLGIDPVIRAQLQVKFLTEP